MEKRTLEPDLELYRNTLTRLTEDGEMTTLVAIRMGCELGMTRLEIVNAKVSDVDRHNKRGLWIEVAKKVRRGKKKTADGKKTAVFVMRKREVPVNYDFYQVLRSYIDSNQMYVLHREKGDRNKPFIPRYINTLYDKNKVPWRSHKSRHFFKSQVWSWMQKNQQVDVGLMKEYMGHKKTTDEDYGSYSWDYKREVLDKVFGWT